MFQFARMHLMAITLFLGGHVMTGRGIDQILPHPSSPAIYEPYVTDARTYVGLAEEAHGPIPRQSDLSYAWGSALSELELQAPDCRLVNLETAITKSGYYWQGKGINYRMNPQNIDVLTAAGIDIVALANNHVLDWGYEGLRETIGSLDRVRVRHAGAGKDRREAASSAVLDLGPKGRVLVLSAAHGSSGVLPSWAAQKDRPGVNLLQDLSDETASRISEVVRKVKRPGDVAVLSVHWGANWGYDVPEEQVRFSHRLINAAGIDLVFGHSSHHPKPIEVYHGKLILYGCGDLMNDYEGIAGHEAYRSSLSVMYFVKIDAPSGRLLELEMTPLEVRRFRLDRASASDVRWLAEVLVREGKAFGAGVVMTPENRLQLRWKE
jgi:poly-gamma-glutamate capsule biosynthesis protein CapA/YwtB (metallophosphatase superfamily)